MLGRSPGFAQEPPPPGHSCISHRIPDPTFCSPYAPCYRAHHQPLCTTVSLLGSVYSHWSWRCHRKTPALSQEREMKDGEKEKGPQRHRADPRQGLGKGLLPSLPGPCPRHASQPGWDPLEHPCGSRSRCCGAACGAGLSSPPDVAAPLTHPLPLCQSGRAAHGTSAKTGGGCPASWTLPWPAGSTWPPSSPGEGSLAASARGTRAIGH